MVSKETLIARLRESANGGWGGIETHRDADRLERFVRKILANYSTVLGFSEGEILRKIEGRRDYWSMNFYQESNFPLLENVEVFETVQQFKDKFPSRKFICPACGGVSTHPTTCNSGKRMKGVRGGICDWKLYGLFGTLGKGYRFVVKEDFLKNPVVYEWFVPIEIAKTQEKTKEGV